VQLVIGPGYSKVAPVTLGPPAAAAPPAPTTSAPPMPTPTPAPAKAPPVSCR
jgi:hypothetical protein